MTNSCSLSITNLNNFAPRVSANSAGESGGGIFIAGSNSVANLYSTIIGGKNTGNVCNAQLVGTDGGGGIFIDESAIVNAINCNFQDNFSSNFGGGIFLGTNAILNISCDNKSSRKSYIVDNFVINSGGGIFSKLAKNLLVENTIIISNVAQNGSGGGLYLSQSPNKFVNLLIAQNDNGYALGADGIFFHKCPKSELLQCTIADNDSIGINNYSAGSDPVYMTNCIVYGHSLSQLWANSEINIVYSDIETGYPGIGNIDADPLFSDQTTFNYKIVLGSPCEDAGIDLPSVTNDLDGTLRPQGTGYDMGAFEVIPEPSLFLILLLIPTFLKGVRGI